MAKPPLPESPTQTDDVLEDSFYEVPAELEDPGAAPTQAQPPVDGEPPEEDLDELPLQPRRFPVALASGAALAVICIVGGLVAYRCHGQRKVVSEGLSHAEQLMVLDTADGYRKAADLLAPLAKLDPLDAGSMRAFALAMLACDYRDTQAEEEANRLLVVPGRADPMPRYASLAFRALALGRDALADAALERGAPEEAAAEAHTPAEPPWARMLSARVDLSAGSYESAVEYAGGAAGQPGFAAGLAVHGDAFRRARRDYQTALSSYEAALAASPANPRAAFGLAKVALSGTADVEPRARAALQRVLASEATPRRARGRAALHLAALRIRAGDPVDAVRKDVAAELGAGLTAKELDWLMGAARAEAANRGAYKAVADPPEALKTKTDDDLEDKGFHALSPEPPPPPPPPPAVEPPPKATPHAASKGGQKAGKAHAAPVKKGGKSVKAAAKGSAGKKASTSSKAGAKKKTKKTR